MQQVFINTSLSFLLQSTMSRLKKTAYKCHSMSSFWHRMNVITQVVVVKKDLEGHPVGLRVSLCLCPEERPALPAAVAGCFPTLPSVFAAHTTPSGAAPPEAGNAKEQISGKKRG